MSYEILEALGQIAREKNVDRDLVLETLQAGLVSDARKKYGANANVDVAVDAKAPVLVGLEQPHRRQRRQSAHQQAQIRCH